MSTGTTKQNLSWARILEHAQDEPVFGMAEYYVKTGVMSETQALVWIALTLAADRERLHAQLVEERRTVLPT